MNTIMKVAVTANEMSAAKKRGPEKSVRPPKKRR
jgi:hypothetical protein